LAGASPQTPLGELKALPRPLAGFKRSYLGGSLGGEGRKGEGVEEKEKEMDGPLLIW